MSELSFAGFATALAAGPVSFLSPCVLPLVPGYVSYVAGSALAQPPGAQSPANRLAALLLAACFVLGFSTVFIALGASATLIGQMLLRYRTETNLAAGAIVIVFGLFMTGAIRPSWLMRDVRFHGELRGGGPLAAYLIGAAFGCGWTPCIGPVLGAILTVSAASATVPGGIALLSAYCLGLGIPFMATALFTGAFMKRYRALRRIGAPLQIVAGLGMVLMGLAMMAGWLTTLSLWLLDTFPAFSGIG
ncbi:MAG: cytochrome c biogenesis protein CcdA [Burkholderiales bacterium]|nr:cytochrome c biogenesis protein CcdA [Burkholderiales bacterium]